MRLTGGAAHTPAGRRLPWPTGTSRFSTTRLRILLSLPCVPRMGAKRPPITNLPAVVVALPWCSAPRKRDFPLPRSTVLPMRTINRLLLTLWLGLVVAGCSQKPFPGKTVDKFVGRVTANGQPVSFPAEQMAELKTFHETGQQFGIPIKEDGTFVIGWMPVGKYAVMLERRTGAKTKGPGMSRYSVPDGLTIEEGKTEYVVELGK